MVMQVCMQVDAREPIPWINHTLVLVRFSSASNCIYHEIRPDMAASCRHLRFDFQSSSYYLRCSWTSPQLPPSPLCDFFYFNEDQVFVWIFLTSSAHCTYIARHARTIYWTINVCDDVVNVVLNFHQFPAFFKGARCSKFVHSCSICFLHDSF